jgi:polyphosphate kinase
MTLLQPDESPASPSSAPAVRSAVLPAPKDLIDRHLSLLEFQRRVLDEARDPANPLLERVKLLSIVGANLDEFAMTRMGALEEAGAHVTYGLAGLKVHGKLSLVVRREGSKLQRYVHASSGNYNTATAQIYTDLALLTCDPDIASDAADLFNVLSGHAAPESFRKLIVAPYTIRRAFRERVEDEIANHRAGHPARIVLKMNALTDPETIALLYRASQAGVRVELIVRGICCLRPGVGGLSDNITVRSIVGRFLEHSRVWHFGAAGANKMYIGSADLLGAYLRDNVKARELAGDGTYTRVARTEGNPAFSAQEFLLHVHHGATRR